mgnify:CR=1 FL=1
MPVISVCSPKGGVGKTTLAANLAYVFAHAGTKVITVDFDPQNSLRLYFGVPLSEDRGFITRIEDDVDWLSHTINVGKNLYTLPYGHSNAAQREYLNRRLQEPGFLRMQQSSIFANDDVLTIIDFPPGYSEALKAVVELSDLHIIPLLADAASISLFTQIENEELIEGPLNLRLGYRIVLNEIDNRIKLNREIQDFARENFGDKLLGTIHNDTSVIEAAALQQGIIDFNPNSSAGFDIEVIGRKVGTIMGFEVKQDTMLINPLSKAAQQ